MGIDAKIIRTGRGSSAAKAKLRRAYREKAFETHPDKKLPNVRPRLLSTMHVQQTMERTRDKLEGELRDSTERSELLVRKLQFHLPPIRMRWQLQRTSFDCGSMSSPETKAG